MPLVSVIIPTYNQEFFIADAVESVLAQTVSDLEILVVDDGSSDRTGEVLSRYGPPVRYIRQDNAGAAEARNRGIENSRGRYVAFLDGDDAWHPAKLERQLAALHENPNSSVCYCACYVTDATLRPSKILHAIPYPNLLESLLIRGNVVGIPGVVMAERQLLLRAGCFDPNLSYCTDWDLWIRLARLAKFCPLDEPLAYWRQHENNMTRQIPLLERDSVRVLEKAIADPGILPAHRPNPSRVFGRNWMVLAGSYYRSGMYRDFIRCSVKSLLSDPGQLRYLISYPLRQFRGYKGVWLARSAGSSVPL